MKRLRSPHRRRWASFTLVELLVVIAIIGLLAGLAQPAFAAALRKAQSLSCGTNLRSIGVAVSLAATDNNNTYPEINQTSATGTSTSPYPNSVGGIATVLGPYNIGTNSIKCPSDIQLGTTSAFTLYGSSYEWNPVFDDEVEGDAVIFPTPTNPITVNNSRVRLCTDFNGIHRGKMNALYGDGHVKSN